MRAATVENEAIVVREHPDPEPGSGEVLIRVGAAGLNGADVMQRAGRYPAPPGSPADIPGLELAGEVIATGSGQGRFEVGDRVMGIAGGGGQAELATLHERQLMPVPDDVEMPAAGGFPEVFTTAHDAVFTQCGLRSGERICVHGAAGGVGLAAIQLAREAGASVVATVRDESRREAVAGFGAEALAPEEFVDAGPFDVILELVGAPNLGDNVKALATNGRICVIGVSAGAKGEINLLGLMGKRGTLRASTLRARPLEEKAMTARLVERHVLPLLADGRIEVPIDSTFALADAPDAYARFTGGGKLGKIVLTMD